MPESKTYTPSPQPAAKKFVCRRCRREYAYPQPGGAPIRCECGWWYENVAGRICEAYWERIGSYRTPPPDLF